MDKKCSNSLNKTEQFRDTDTIKPYKVFDYDEEPVVPIYKVQSMQNYHKKQITFYEPGSGLYLVHKRLIEDTEAKLNPERLKELADPVKKIEEPVVEKANSLKDCLEVHKEPESKKYERRSLREDLGLTEKSEQKDDE